MSREASAELERIENKAIEECVWCRPIDANKPLLLCLEPVGEYRCTRQKEHDGPHVACGAFAHPIEIDRRVTE